MTYPVVYENCHKHLQGKGIQTIKNAEKFSAGGHSVANKDWTLSELRKLASSASAIATMLSDSAGKLEKAKRHFFTTELNEVERKLRESRNRVAIVQTAINNVTDPIIEEMEADELHAAKKKTAKK